MSPKEDTYKNRDMLLGRIDERTSHIPKMREDINKLSKKIAIVEIKSGVFGTLGGGLTVAIIYMKDYFLHGRFH